MRFILVVVEGLEERGTSQILVVSALRSLPKFTRPQPIFIPLTITGSLSRRQRSARAQPMTEQEEQVAEDGDPE